ncbi:transposon Ty3-G Gag-Pol polyprotein [Nephila pilipes]|uniref:Transposon Ty3-G Gag-Pol polyprotein n=1 Tax=Nephila pilipes TaxID=299642 RepID=A0A8X6N9B0_NEPPI|nr:transposon Ty3-G Gag-Pol polyprotein [Nephila pilipes]
MYNFYRRFIPKATLILAPLIKFFEDHVNKKKPRASKNPLECTKEADNSAAKATIADATLLKHLIPCATLNLRTDASNFAINSSLPGKRFFWPSMRKEIKDRIHACDKCQVTKVFKNTKVPFSTFVPPDARFVNIRIGYIEPFPDSIEYKYCLAIMNRHTQAA